MDWTRKVNPVTRARAKLHEIGIAGTTGFREDKISLEDIFIALTGKY